MRRLTAYERALYRAASGRNPPWCLVQRWPWWWRNFRGLAFGCVILVKDENDPVLVCHEVAHVTQFCTAPLRFWFSYVRELLRVGYMENRYECEARAVEAKATRVHTSRAK